MDDKRAYYRDWYQKNKAQHLKNVAKRKKLVKVDVRQKLQEVKNKPCFDCGGKFIPFQMDFDHRPDEKKSEDVSVMVAREFSWKSIQAEIDKCDLVCANCHRLRTYNRMCRGSSVWERPLFKREAGCSTQPHGFIA